MKKILLAFAILAGSMSFAQTVETTTNNVEMSESELLTSIKPQDENPAIFPTQEELDAKQADKIEKIKQQIIENRDNLEMVAYLREELWRFENAIVVENKK